MKKRLLSGIHFNMVNYCLAAREQGSSKLDNLLNGLAAYVLSYERLYEFYHGTIEKKV